MYPGEVTIEVCAGSEQMRRVVELFTDLLLEFSALERVAPHQYDCLFQPGDGTSQEDLVQPVVSDV